MDGTRVLVVTRGQEEARHLSESLASVAVEAVTIEDGIGPVLDARVSERFDCVVGGDDLGRDGHLSMLAAIHDGAGAVPVVLETGDPPDLGGIETVTAVEPGAPERLRETVRELVADGDVAEHRKQRDRFRTLFEQIPDPVLIAQRVDGEPAVRAVNPAFEAVFGYTTEEVRGEPIAQYVVPEDLDEDDLVDLSTADIGEVVEEEVRRRTATGEREFLFRGVRMQVGDQVEDFCIYTDITDRKRRARRLDALHGTTQDLLAADGTEAIAETAVEAAQEVLGLPAVGVHFVDSTDEGDRLVPVATSDETRELFDGAPPAYGPDDETVWEVYESGVARVIRDAERDEVDRNAPVRSVLLLPLGDHGVLISSGEGPREFDDETVDLARLLAANTEAALDRAANEAALRERERDLTEQRDRLAALFENAPIPVADIEFDDSDPIVRDVNAAFEETFGYDAETLIGDDIDTHIVPESHREPAEEYNERAASGRTVGAEVQRETTDGLRDFLLTVAPVDPDDDGSGVFAFYIDITERKQRQQRLRVLSRVLRHDIRNQMNIIDGNADIIAKRANGDDLESPSARISRATAELLSLSRKTRAVEESVASDGHDAVDLVDEVVAAVSTVQGRYPAANIEVDVPDRLIVRGSGAVGVAVEELLENAAQHNDAEEPQVRVTVEADGQYAVLEIADDGPGIPDTDREIVEGNREQTQLEHASGIGLWTVKWIVTGVGGDLLFEDRDPRGTLVTVRLPLGGDILEE